MALQITASPEGRNASVYAQADMCLGLIVSCCELRQVLLTQKQHKGQVSFV